ncbi:MAG: diguanylate cyclase [Spirochaetia bacterium]
MILSIIDRIRTWVTERAPDRHAGWATVVLIIVTATGTGVLAAHFLPREANLAISGLLFVAFILWPLWFGYLGSIVSAVFLLIGARFTIHAWMTDDDVYYLSIAVFQVATVISGFIIATLVEGDRRLRRELEQVAIVDGLTGLYNYKHFVARIQEELASRSRTDEETTVMYMDLDNFKPINDTFGHQRGDAYLRAFAALLLEVVRAGDTAYRLGGDEFAVILPGTDETGARRVGERLNTEMALRDLSLPEKANRPSVSIGISVAPDFAENAAELMTQADSALYHAKHAGRGQIKLFHDVFVDILHYFSSGNEQLNWSLKSLLWGAAVRDQYTYEHSERVSDYAAALAAESGLEADKVAAIRIAAVLHDIGRAQIPQEILLKSGPLTQSEHALVQKHPDCAATILKPLAGIGSVVEDVRHHHERVDGTGYPSGLAGDAIPVGARIIAVADSFDAMCSDRPYRRAMTVEQAIREVRQLAGIAFDPAIVAAAAVLLPRLARGGDG